MRLAPYPGDDPQQAGQAGSMAGAAAAPIFGWDMAELLTLSNPVRTWRDGLFEFDGVPVKALVLQSMRSSPQIGHFSAELQSGNEAFARFDRLPAGSMLSISITGGAAVQAGAPYRAHPGFLACAQCPGPWRHTANASWCCTAWSRATSCFR